MTKTISLKQNQALSIPLYLSGKETVLKIEAENFFTELKTILSSEETDKKIVLPLPLSAPITISGEEALISKISTTEFKETESALSYHFTPQFGWINDPNGMIYHNDYYHLFFQYNPVGREWSNMSWGHAYSKDLIKWTQTKTAMFPEDIDHTIFSGSAIKIEDEIYFPYTVANITPPQDFKQCLAVSKDMKSLEQKGTFLYTGGEVRDPRAFYYNDKLYFLTFDKDNDFSLYEVEGKFEKVKKLSTSSLPPLWECPDLYQIKDENGNNNLFFTGADGIVHKAEIKNNILVVEKEGKSLFLTKLPYAGQTFSNVDEPILISWLRTKNEGKLYHGAMGIPRKLSLKNGEIVLLEAPDFNWKEIESCEANVILKQYGTAYKFVLKCKDFTTITIGNSLYTFDPKNGKFSSKDESVNFKGENGCIIIYIDDEIMEVQDSTLTSVAYFECDISKVIKIESKEQFKMTTYHLGG